MFFDVFSTVFKCCTFSGYFEIFVTVSCFISTFTGYWVPETDTQRLFHTLQPGSIAWEWAVMERQLWF